MALSGVYDQDMAARLDPDAAHLVFAKVYNAVMQGQQVPSLPGVPRVLIDAAAAGARSDLRLSRHGGAEASSGQQTLLQLAREMAPDPKQSGGWDALYRLAHEMGQDPGNPLGDMSNEEVIALLDEIAEGKSAGQDIVSASPGASVEIGTIDFADRASIMEQLALAQKETAELDHEVCYSVTADGKVWKVSGEAGTVNPSGISSSLAGSYSFHNHPREKTWHSFSPEDVRSFFKLGEQLAKASDYLYEYTMERTEDTVDIDPDEVYNRFIELLQKEVFEMKWKREIDPDKDAFHAAMEILSRELNFKYERKEAR